MMHRMHLVHLSLVVAVFALVTVALPAQEAGAHRAVNAILDEFERCFIDEDVEGIGALLSDDYVLVVTSRDGPNAARTFDKEGYLQVESHRFASVDFLEHRHIDREVTVLGPVATSASTIVNRRRNGDRGESRVFHAYARINGEWKVIFTSPHLAE